MNQLCISFEISCFKCVSPCVLTHEIQGAWRPVWSLGSLFCGLHVILLALVGVGPLCFLESKAIAAVHQEIIELSMLQSTDKLYRDADFLSSRAFHLLIVPKLLPNGLPVILSLCLIDHPTELTIQLNIHPGTPQEWLHACHNSFRKVSERSPCISWSLLVKEDQIKWIIKATF